MIQEKTLWKSIMHDTRVTKLKSIDRNDKIKSMMWSKMVYVWDKQWLFCFDIFFVNKEYKKKNMICSLKYCLV